MTTMTEKNFDLTLAAILKDQRKSRGFRVFHKHGAGMGIVAVGGASIPFGNNHIVLTAEAFRLSKDI